MFSLLSLIRNGETLQAVIFILSGCFAVFVCLPIHELAHGWVAYKLGDKTAKAQGRLTFNPLAHIDPIGLVMILVFGFGYAKAVPVNMRYFKNPKRDMALVALAGPASNLVMAWISAFFYYALPVRDSGIIMILSSFFLYATVINVSLGAFNLIPIPPLDGSKILAAVLPNEVYYKYMQYERYAMIALLVILATGILGNVLNFIVNILLNLISFIPQLIFG